MSISNPQRTGHIDGQVVRFVYRQGPVALLANLVVGAIAVGTLWSELPHTMLVGWIGVMAAVVTARLILVWTFKKTATSESNLHRWGYCYVAGCFATGLMWGSAGLIIALTPSLPHQFVVVLIVLGMCAGAVGSNAAMLPAFVSFLLPAMLPLTVLFFIDMHALNVGLGTVSLLFAVFLYLLARNVCEMTRETMGLAWEKNSLLKNHRVSRKELRKTVARLEESIARREAAEEHLVSAKERAEAADRAKTVFLSTMSHEIRTPLNAVLGMTQALEETELNSQQREYLRVCSRAGQHLLGLVSNVLDLTKIESGELKPESRHFDLHALVEEVGQVAGIGAEMKGVQFATRIDPNVTRFVKGDARGVLIVLTNLIANAVKFTDQGRIEVTVENMPPEPGQHRLLFSVTDSGVGVATEHQENIFATFVQADATLTRMHAGSGLGLSICRQLVKGMGGHMMLESIPGRGSVFAFSIPLANGDESLARKTESADRHDQKPTFKHRPPVPTAPGALPRLLVVDDSVDNRLVVKAFLKEIGIEISEADNGKDGLECVQRGSYDLVLMDVHMPVMDGISAIREIRQWEEKNSRGRVPIIVLSADALVASREDAKTAGCDAYLSKPIKKYTLREIVRQFLGLERPGLKPPGGIRGQVAGRVDTVAPPL